MSFILDESSKACCSVSTCWKPASDKTLTYATIVVSQASRERRASSSSPSSGGAPSSLIVSGWTSYPAPSAEPTWPKGLGYASSDALGSKPESSKSFKKVFETKKSLSEKKGAVRILDVRIVLSEQDWVEYTYILISVSRRGGEHVLYLFCIECDEVVSVGDVVVMENPVKAIITRGPSIIVSFLSEVCLLNFESGEDRVLATCRASTVHFIGASTRDDISVLCTITGTSRETESRVSIQTVDCTGALFRSVELQGVYSIDLNPNSFEAFISKDDNLLFMAGLSDNLCVFDTTSGRLTSHITFPNSASLVRFAHFAGELYFICPSNSTNSGYELFSATNSDRNLSPVDSTEESSLSILTAKPIFRNHTDCTFLHLHFYVDWRGRLLEISAVNGVCCNDSLGAVDSSAARERNGKLDGLAKRISSQLTAPPAVVSHLRQRFDTGIKHLMGIIERNEENRRILFFLIRLLSDVVRAPEIAPQAGVLDVRLRRVATKAEQVASSISASDDQDNMRIVTKSEDLPCVRLWVTGQSHQARSDPFVRIIGASYHIDDIERFVVVNVEVEMLPKDTIEENVEKTTSSGFVLIISIDPCCALTWRLISAQNVCSENAVRVAATIPLADIVIGATGVRQPVINVCIERTDGSVQQLGSFGLSGLLTDDHKASKTGKIDESIHAFEQFIYLLVQGINQSKLRLISNLEPAVKLLSSKEGTAYVQLRVLDGVQMARVSEKLKVAAGRDAKIQQVLPFTKTSLGMIDEALLALRQEVNVIRDVVTPIDAAGFSLQQVVQILEWQRIVDNKFGILKEYILAFG